MNRLRNVDTDTLFPYIMTWGLLLLISSFFVPVVTVMFIQDLLFFSADNWSFIRPVEAYIGFGVGMIWIAIVLFSFLFTKMHSEKKNRTYKLTGLHLILFVVAFPLFVFSIYHYAYFDEHGVQGNSFWTLSEDSIAWDEVQEVTRTVAESSQRVMSYTFSDGDTSITIPYDPQDYQTVQSIKRVVNIYNWNITDNVEGE
ncbi:hypothetical protein [Bacillus sp. FJAT-45350]|uniref:hypothetical protein n=1 Tax=Bacillus sp. FJAT-45350 TaxID=2011014 RepID=UPI000BB6843C|nr:hypothetical protein [Bacillus sp. FJAT-45350]